MKAHSSPPQRFARMIVLEEDTKQAATKRKLHRESSERRNRALSPERRAQLLRRGRMRRRYSRIRWLRYLNLPFPVDALARSITYPFVGLTSSWSLVGASHGYPSSRLWWEKLQQQMIACDKLSDSPSWQSSEKNIFRKCTAVKVFRVVTASPAWDGMVRYGMGMVRYGMGMACSFFAYFLSFCNNNCACAGFKVVGYWLREGHRLWRLIEWQWRSFLTNSGIHEKWQRRRWCRHFFRYGMIFPVSTVGLFCGLKFFLWNSPLKKPIDRAMVLLCKGNPHC